MSQVNATANTGRFSKLTLVAGSLLLCSLFVLATPQLVGSTHSLPVAVRGIAAILSLVGVVLLVATSGDNPPPAQHARRELALWQAPGVKATTGQPEADLNVIDVEARETSKAPGQRSTDGSFGIAVVLAIFVPWVAMLLQRNFGSAVICLLLQFSLAGWLVATIWAIAVIVGSGTAPPAA